jgi:hypothetical protein
MSAGKRGEALHLSLRPGLSKSLSPLLLPLPELPLLFSKRSAAKFSRQCTCFGGGRVS